MRGAVVMLITILLATTVNSHPRSNLKARICSPVEFCTPLDFSTETYKPYPPDCSKYIACKNGENLILQCPRGLLYNQLTRGCSAPEETDCLNCEMPSLKISEYLIDICPPIEICTPPELGTVKPYPPDCTKYFYCDENGESRFQRCPTERHFSPTFLFCRDPEIAGCPYCIVPKPCAEPETCSLGELGILKPYPPDCSKYIYCDENGDEILLTCPIDYHFSPIELYCTDPLTAMCPTCVTPAPTTIAICPPTDTCSVAEVGFLKPYPPDCTKYIYCDENGDEILLSCPIDYNFSPSELRCMDPQLAMCSYCVTFEPTVTTIPICPPNETCSIPESGLYKPYPPDCTKYIFCDEYGEAIMLTCSVGEHFSPTAKRCKDIEIANCPYCIALEPTTTPVSLLKNVFQLLN